MINSTINSFEFKAIPTFGIHNYKTAIEFYIGFLGFKIDWEHRFRSADPVYMQVSYNGLILHLSENKRFDTKAIAFVETINIKGFHNELKNRSSESNIPDIALTNWQTMQLEIEDPFGNLLRFNENVVKEL